MILLSSGNTGRRSLERYFISDQHFGHSRLVLSVTYLITGDLQWSHQNTSWGGQGSVFEPQISHSVWGVSFWHLSHHIISSLKDLNLFNKIQHWILMILHMSKNLNWVTVIIWCVTRISSYFFFLNLRHRYVIIFFIILEYLLYIE